MVEGTEVSASAAAEVWSERAAAALLEWIVGLRPEEYLGRLTPVVEDHLELDIGIKTDWLCRRLLGRPASGAGTVCHREIRPAQA